MTIATPVPVPKPPGNTRRKRSWLRRNSSSKLGGTGPRGPPPPPRPLPQGPPPPPPPGPLPPPPPRGPVPQGPPPSLCQSMPRTLPRQRAPPSEWLPNRAPIEGARPGCCQVGAGRLNAAQPQPSAVNPKFAVSRGQALSEFRIQSRTGNLKGCG